MVINRMPHSAGRKVRGAGSKNCRTETACGGGVVFPRINSRQPRCFQLRCSSTPLLPTALQQQQQQAASSKQQQQQQQPQAAALA
jgi:hypothetical protein